MTYGVERPHSLIFDGSSGKQEEKPAKKEFIQKKVNLSDSPPTELFSALDVFNQFSKKYILARKVIESDPQTTDITTVMGDTSLSELTTFIEEQSSFFIKAKEAIEKHLTEKKVDFSDQTNKNLDSPSSSGVSTSGSLMSEESLVTTSHLPPVSLSEMGTSGFGVIANRTFEEGNDICEYEGSLCYRIPNKRKKGCFFVFEVVEKADGCLDIKPLENDRFIAWSKIKIKGSEVELGINGTGPAMHLNHSKKPNVDILVVSPSTSTVGWDSRSVVMSVRATRQIRKREELLFDYDPDVEKIDFDKSLVSRIDEDQKRKIAEKIGKLSSRKIVAVDRMPKKEMDVPEDLLDIWDEVEESIDKIHSKCSAPPSLETYLESEEKSLLELMKAILVKEKTDLTDLNTILSKHLSKEVRVTADDLAHFTECLSNHVYNNKKVSFSLNDLKEGLLSQGSKKSSRHRLGVSTIPTNRRSRKRTFLTARGAHRFPKKWQKRSRLP